MDDPKKPKNTIRVGTKMYDDVIDFVCLIRTRNEDGSEYVATESSDMNWADGAMRSEIGFIEHLNTCWGEGDDQNGD